MGAATAVSLDAVRAALQHLSDPEIPVVSLSELGILREVRHGDDGVAEVVITPTYSGCPAMGQIEDDIRAALTAAGLSARVVTQLTPAWTTVPCPRCGSRHTTETSPFGSTACKSMWRCLDCLEPFDLFKPY